ncbi:MAG: hypothetical protein ABSH52_32970, partial [Terriglobia bacterium]
MKLVSCVLLFFFILILPWTVVAESRPLGAYTTLVIPRVSTPPRLEDFLSMKPDSKWEGKLAKV